MDHPLARLDGIASVLAILLRGGDICAKCGHATRVVSRKWKRCQKCGARIERKQDQLGQQAGKGREE